LSGADRGGAGLALALGGADELGGVDEEVPGLLQGLGGAAEGLGEDLEVAPALAESVLVGDREVEGVDEAVADGEGLAFAGRAVGVADVGGAGVLAVVVEHGAEELDEARRDALGTFAEDVKAASLALADRVGDGEAGVAAVLDGVVVAGDADLVGEIL